MKTFEYGGRVLKVPSAIDSPDQRQLSGCYARCADNNLGVCVGIDGACDDCLFDSRNIPAFIAWEKAQEAGEEGAG